MRDLQLNEALSNPDNYFPWPTTEPTKENYFKDMAFYLVEGYGTCLETDIVTRVQYQLLPRVAQNIVKIYYDRIKQGENIYA